MVNDTTIHFIMCKLWITMINFFTPYQIIFIILFGLVIWRLPEILNSISSFHLHKKGKQKKKRKRKPTNKRNRNQ